MTFFFAILSTLLISAGPSASLHEFHLSTSTINYDTEEQAIQVTMKLFIDDLELALEPTAGDTLRICTRRESPLAESYISDYIHEHFLIELDGKNIKPVFIGKEPSDDLAAVWCYLEVENISPPSSVIITNSIMTEIFDDQNNMTTIQKDKVRLDDIRFTAKKTSEQIKL